MTPRLAVPAAPAPLEAFAACFDDLLCRRSQRQGFRRYLEGLLLGQERNKTLTALANAEPVLGAQNASVQGLQWFLSESCWQVQEVNARRKNLLLSDPQTAPTREGVLILDETGDRKDGKATAHVGRQYLANLGKVDNGVVSVTSLYADERLYYPLEVEPYTPAHWFAHGQGDPGFRTKPQIALALVQRAVAAGTPFRAVVADCFYGENAAFRSGLVGMESGPVGFVLGLKRSHCWWHAEGEVGSLLEAAEGARWESAQRPGDWSSVTRTFSDGHEELWWALEVRVGSYGPEQETRTVVATTDPEHLPEASTWFLITNLPAPDAERAKTSGLACADLTEVVRLYGLRTWVEQSYKQVKHALGWAEYQVRGDRAIRRHWALVMCAFSFVWWHQSHFPTPAAASDPAPLHPESAALLLLPPSRQDIVRERGGKGRFWPASADVSSGMLAGGASGSTLLAGAVDLLRANLARMDRPATARGVTAPARMGVQRGRPLSLR
jgi:SRSO17 transposase